MQNLAKNALLILGFLFALVLLVLGLNELRTLFAGAEASPIPTNINVTGTTSNSATVNFTTEKNISSLVSYGTEPQNLSLFSAESEQTTTHALTLSFLSPNTTYYFTVKIGDKTYDNNGSPYQFTTKPAPQTGQGTGTTGTQFDNLDGETFKQKFGSSDSNYDLNRDGVVNSTDYLLYLKKTQE